MLVKFVSYLRLFLVLVFSAILFYQASQAFYGDSYNKSTETDGTGKEIVTFDSGNVFVTIGNFYATGMRPVLFILSGAYLLSAIYIYTKSNKKNRHKTDLMLSCGLLAYWWFNSFI